MAPKRRSIGPEDEDRRTDRPAATPPSTQKAPRPGKEDAKEAGVESLPDGEAAAEEEAAKARDD